MNRSTHKISVITITLNSAHDLKKTMVSVLGQDYPQIEYIIIDGGSTDGTLEVIKTNAGHVACWISEPDRGIYDAMNKGLAKATGEWVNFMNAGDVFNNDHVLSAVFNHDPGDAAVLYGDSIARYLAFNAWRKARSPEDLWKGMFCCHQSMFFRTSLIKNEGYRTGDCFSADYEMIHRLYHAGKTFRYIPETIAVFDTRGISNMQMVKSARSNLEILSSFRTLTLKERRFHRWVIFKSALTEWMYKFLPSPVIHSMLRQVYRNQIISESSRP